MRLSQVELSILVLINIHVLYCTVLDLGFRSKMGINNVWLFFILSIGIGLELSLAQVCDVGADPCNPHRPCSPSERLSDPTNCYRFRQCIAPQEWVFVDTNCDEDKGAFSNITCLCGPGNTCTTWTCAPVPTSPPIESEPCLTGNPEDDFCLPGRAIPDSFYCTSYFQCSEEGQWIREQCPDEEPYFDKLKADNFQPDICSNNLAVCENTPFDECIVSDPEVTTGMDVTTEDDVLDTTYADFTTEVESSAPPTTPPVPPVPPACDPPLPCEQGRRISYPLDCEMYQQCIAPQQWIPSDIDCGGDKGPFDPDLELCHPDAPCLNLTCGVKNDTDTAPSEPCFLDGRYPCNINDLTIPDRNYCTSYFVCTDGVWQRTECPEAEPYFDINKSNEFEQLPCSNNIARCDSIPFDECQTSPNVTETY